MMDFARSAVANCFLVWATGPALDAKAGEVGTQRLASTPAQVTVSFVGTEGTVIPAGTQVAAPGDEVNGIDGATFATTYLATISGGIANVLCEATEDGAGANVASGQIIELVTPVLGIESIVNQYAATGGTDEESDEFVRSRALISAQQPPAGGNVGYYTQIALEEATVGAVKVTDLWNTIGPAQAAKSAAGSGLIALTGRNNPWVSPDVIERLQSSIDPSVRNLAHFEAGEVWSISSGTSVSAESISDDAIEGESSWLIHPLTGATTTIEMGISNAYDLTAYSSAADELWLEYSAPTGYEPSSVLIQMGNVGWTKYVTGTVTGGALPTVRGRIVIARSSLAATGGSVAAAFASVGKIRVSVVAPGGHEARVTVDGLRMVLAQGGHGLGLATMGMQLTVKSARAKMINVSATVTLNPGVSPDSARADIEYAVRVAIAGTQAGSTLTLASVRNAIYLSGPVIDYANVTIAEIKDGEHIGKWRVWYDGARTVVTEAEVDAAAAEAKPAQDAKAHEVATELARKFVQSEG